jgi:hypothetical protein
LILTNITDIRQNIGPDTSKKVEAGSLFLWPGGTLHAGWSLIPDPNYFGSYNCIRS